MASKKLTWAILGLCGSLLAMTVSTATQAADQPAKQIATSDAKQDTLMCRDLDIPGSHVKEHVCGVPAKWSDTQVRLTLMRGNFAAAAFPHSGGPAVIPGYNGGGAVPSMSNFQR
jgi:hypothetical protein